MAQTYLVFDMDVPEDMQGLDRALKATEYQATLSELDEWLRTKLKYSELEEPVVDALQETRDKLHNLLEVHSITLD